MNEITYQIEFYSSWHCGSGLSAGTDTDTLVVKNSLGLPYIPGKTLKGLIRFAAFELSCEEHFVNTCFGKEASKEEDETTQGCCYFSNAQLSKEFQNHFIHQENGDKQEAENMKEMLYEKIASTAIDKNGIAKEHSLRTAQVVIPITLYGAIEGVPNEYIKTFTQCLKMVKRLGMGRNKGYGRCDISIIDPLTTEPCKD